jgi:hypothetical protein
MQERAAPHVHSHASARTRVVNANEAIPTSLRPPCTSTKLPRHGQAESGAFDLFRRCAHLPALLERRVP